MTIPTDPPAELLQILIFIRLGIIAFIPVVVILYAAEQAKSRGISFRDCAWAITKRVVLYIAGLEVIVAIAYVFYRNQYEAVWNIANGYSAAPLLGVFGGLAGLGLLWFACWYFPAMGVVLNMASAGVNQRLRGSLVIDGSANQDQDAKWREDFDRKSEAGQYVGTIRLAGLSMPTAAEVLHTLIIGTTGTGKSVTIRSTMRDIEERAKHTGERMLICDPDGGYTSRFFSAKRGDKILNPFDERSGTWAMFKEIRTPYDCDNIAAALVPDPGGDSGEWARKARIIVSSALDVLSHTPGAETRDLYEVCCLATVPELRELLAKTPAARFLEEGNERTMLSILTTVTDALTALRYLDRGDDFSITEWVRQGKGWLFLPYTAEQIAALKSLFRTWVRTAIFSTLSLPERDNGLWFVVDEFDALGKMEGLSDALPRLCKFGGRVIFGMQTIGMVEQLYGRGYSDAIAENCGNKFILRCSSGKSQGDGTSQFASHLIGQRQMRRMVQSTNESSGSGWSRGESSSHRGTALSMAEQIAIEDAVLPAEIEQLPDLTGYLKFATLPEWQRITFPVDGLPVVAQAYTPKTPKDN